MTRKDSFDYEGGEIRLWVEQETTHILACEETYKDPVELTTETARQTARKLNEPADFLDEEFG